MEERRYDEPAGNKLSRSGATSRGVTSSKNPTPRLETSHTWNIGEVTSWVRSRLASSLSVTSAFNRFTGKYPVR